MISKRIVLIHATPVSMAPITHSFARLWPEIEITHILEEALAVDRAKNHDLEPAIFDRIAFLAEYAMKLHPAGILFTCSAFGPAIEAVAKRLPLPVLKPNEAMFEEAFSYGPRIGLITTFPASIVTMKDEFSLESARQRPDANLVSHFVPHAMDALRNGDATTHNRLIAEAISHVENVDAIMLGQFSIATAFEEASKCTDLPLLTAPDAAVRKLRRLLSS